MPRCRAVCHHFPDRRFYQSGRPSLFQSARDLLNSGDFSPRPDFLHGPGYVSKGRKALSPGMQEDQIVVTKFRECLFGPNPEDPLPKAGQPSCGLRFGKVVIPSFVILHAASAMNIFLM